MTVELMTEKRKRNIGIVSFVPLVICSGVILYQFLLYKPGQAATMNGDAMATAAARHIDTLTWLYGIAAIITFAALIYFIIHLLKIKNMTPGNKIAWAVVMATLPPLSLPLFWLMQVKHEPRRLEVKEDIR